MNRIADGFLKKHTSAFREIQTTSTLSPLSQEDDPRVKKLKKELEKIDISPKTKYINFEINNN